MSAVILSGSFLLAVPIAVFAGLLSFASPCVLPLVPGYVAYVSGLAGTQMQEEMAGKKVLRADGGERGRDRLVWGAGLFVAGFSAVFVSMGWLVGFLFSWGVVSMGELTQFLGVIVVVMGIIFLGGFNFLQRDFRLKSKPPRGFWGAPVLGMVFALSWTPCMGPVLATVYVLSLSGGADGARGALLLLMYCMGLGIPFIMISCGLSKGMQVLNFFRSRQAFLVRFGGTSLIAIGLAMVIGWWQAWVVVVQGWLGDMYLPV